MIAPRWLLLAILSCSAAIGGAARADDPDAELLPVPPVPPRIAQGEEYERCLAQIDTDAPGAAAFAASWAAAGGGEAAHHCQALADVAADAVRRGAAALDTLAAASQAPELQRALVYAQATQAWLIAEDPQRADASATLALSLSPDDPDLLIDRAITTASLGRFVDAADDLTQALALAPTRTDAAVLRAAAWRHLGRLDLAETDLASVLKADPDNPEALLERGIIRQRRGDLAGARADWRHASDLAPGSPTGDLAQQDLSLLDAGPEPGAGPETKMAR